MKRRLSCLVLGAVIICGLTPQCMAKDAAVQAFKLHERYTVSLELEFSRKNPIVTERSTGSSSHACARGETFPE